MLFFALSIFPQQHIAEYAVGLPVSSVASYSLNEHKYGVSNSFRVARKFSNDYQLGVEFSITYLFTKSWFYDGFKQKKITQELGVIEFSGGEIVMPSIDFFYRNNIYSEAKWDTWFYLSTGIYYLTQKAVIGKNNTIDTYTTHSRNFSLFGLGLGIEQSYKLNDKSQLKIGVYGKTLLLMSKWNNGGSLTADIYPSPKISYSFAL